MTPFMNADFLLKTETARKLYHEHAEKMPIIDYHCHINPREIYEDKRYNEAMRDLNTVLKSEPGNALTLYNRSLIYAQVGDFERALDDMDRVININPGNVLAHFNRAAFFVSFIFF